MLELLPVLRDFVEPFVDMPPGIIGFECCESLFTNLKRKATIAAECSARRFLGIRELSGDAEVDNVYWPLGLKNPADGLTNRKSDMALPLRLLVLGAFSPRTLRPLRGISAEEGGGSRFPVASFPPFRAWLRNTHISMLTPG